MAGIDKLVKQKGKVAPTTAAKKTPAFDKALGRIVVTIDGKPRKKTAPPKNVAVAADTLYSLRALRLAAQKVVEEIAAEEAVQREYIIENLPKSKASGITGKLATARIETKERPRVVDWDKFYKFIKKNDRFDLLQRRVSDTAVLEMWEDKKTVPGTEAFTTISVSCTKK